MNQISCNLLIWKCLILPTFGYFLFWTVHYWYIFCCTVHTVLFIANNKLKIIFVSCLGLFLLWASPIHKLLLMLPTQPSKPGRTQLLRYLIFIIPVCQYTGHITYFNEYYALYDKYNIVIYFLKWLFEQKNQSVYLTLSFGQFTVNSLNLKKYLQIYLVI